MQIIDQNGLEFVNVHGGPTPLDKNAFEEMHSVCERLHGKLHTRVERGDVLNTSENRQVGHMFFRNDAINSKLGAVAKQSLNEAMAFAVENLICERSNKTVFDHIIHIGIGGSYLGPRLLSHYGKANGYASLSEVHFMTTGDLKAFNLIHRKIPQNAKVLIVVCSKTFTTRETLEAYAMARDHFPDARAVAITGNSKKAAEVGKFEKCFNVPEWVGGRFSLWTAMSLSVMLEFGTDCFNSFLLGGASIDDGFFSDAPDQVNCHMALSDAANMRQQRYSRCVVPYSEALRFLPDYLQQLEMESLGKKDVPFAAVYGGIGVESQHSFFQFLHEADEKPLVEFVLERGNDMNLAALAQMSAMIKNDTPCQMIVMDEGFYGLGQLIASYEYKVMRLAYLFEVNAYDQPAVELGKQIMRDLQHGIVNDPVIVELKRHV